MLVSVSGFAVAIILTGEDRVDVVSSSFEIVGFVGSVVVS